MSFLKQQLKYWQDGQLYPVLKQQNTELIDSLLNSNNEVVILKYEIRDLEENLKTQQLEYKLLSEDIETQKQEYLKEYFYSKYLKRKNFTWCDKNIRSYALKGLTNKTSITGTSNDKVAQNALKYVRKHITYTSDVKDEWQYAQETLERGKGDCEDGAILMYHLMVDNGVPSWRIRLNAGDVKGGGHAYITYCREKDNRWVVLDWCYWYSESVGMNNNWGLAKNYYGIWFSWNSDYVWVDPDKL